MAVELATAYVSIVPSFKGLEADLAKHLGDPVEQESKKYGDKAGGGFMSSFGGAAKSGALAVGVAVGAAITKGLGDALGQEKGNDKLAAQLGLDPKASAQLGAVAGKLYANAYGDSLDDVNAALKGITQNVGEGNAKWLEDTAAKSLDFTTAFEQDMTRTTAAVGTLLKSGMASDATQAFDILTRGMQLGVDKGEDLLDTFIEYPSVLTKLGLDGQTAMGLLSQGLDAGARNSDVVADALKEFQIRATDGSTASAEGFKLLGLNAKKATAQIAAGGDGAKAGLDEVLSRLRATEDPVKRNAAAVALFGTKAEDLGDALFSLDPGTAAAGLGEVAGAAARMGDTLNNNAATKIETFKRTALMGLANVVATYVIPAGESVARAIGGFWTERGPAITAFFTGSLIPAFARVGSVLTDDVFPAIESVVTFLADHEQILIGVGVVIGGALVAAFVAWAVSAAAAAVSTALALAPVLLLGAALAALVAGVIWAYQNWDWFREAVDKVADAGMWLFDHVLKPLGQWIAGSLVPWVRDTLVPAFVEFGKKVAGVATTLAGWVTDAWRYGGQVLDFFREMPGKIGEFFGGLADTITAPFKAGFNAVAKVWNNTVGSLSFGVPDWVPGLGGKGWDVPDIPTFDRGGVIGGPRGSAQLVLAHGGETVLPTHRMDMGDALGAVGAGGAAPLIGTAVFGDRNAVNDLDFWWRSMQAVA